MSRSQQAKARMAARKEFSSPVPGGGFGGFAAAQSMSGLGYLVVLFDFYRISDANAIVLFKNLLKKDSTTRERALEELVQYVRAHPYEDGGVEDAILEAWAQLYARLSIDDSRRVRELSHNLLLEFMKSARKRMERHISSIVGPWLAGTFDRDRGVARAASEGLALLLSTPEKNLAFWKRCQPRILSYATAALKEKPTTLSDMRVSTKEEADLKYCRVVCGSLSLVSGLLQKLETADIDAGRDDYDKLFSVDAIWRSAVSKDSHTRKAAYDLFSLSLEKKPDLLEPFMPRLAKVLKEEAPKSDQSGSIVAYLKTLTILSRADTAFWETETNPLVLLKPLLEKGSQGTANTSPGSFWQQLEAVFETLPERSISVDQATEVLVSFRKGVSSRDEAQRNSVSAWTVYLSTVRRLVDIVSPAETRVGLVVANVHPLFEHFLHPPDKSVWRSGAQAPIIERACLLCSRPAYPDIVDATRDEWAKLSEAFSKRLANSLPEVSKEYTRSQEDISREGDRWFSVLGNIHHSLVQMQTSSSPNSMNLVEDVLKKPTLDLLHSAIDLLEKRSYKPYGAASLIRAAFSLTPHILQDSGGQSIIESIFPIHDTGKLSLLLSSPSASQMLQCLRALAENTEFHKPYESIFYAVTSAILLQQDAGATGKSITLLIGNAPEISVAVSRRNVKLQDYLETSVLETARGKVSLWDLLEATFATNVLQQDRGRSLVYQIVQGLGSSETDGSSMLRALEIIARHSPQLLLENDELHLELVAKLLGFMEIQESPLSSQASRLRSLIEDHATKEPHLAKIIQEALDMAGPDSLEVDTLVAQAAALEKTASIEEKEGMCPSTNIWMQSMTQFLEARLSPALSITSRLGGAYLLVSGEKDKARVSPKRDRHGLSIPARMAEYTTKRIRGGFDMLSMPNDLRRVESICLLYLVAELGSDQISTTDKDSLWGDLSDPWAMSAAEEAVTSVRQALAVLSKDEKYDETYTALINTMIQRTRQVTPLGLYTSRALSELLQVRAGSRASSVMDEDDIAKLDLWKPSPETAMGALGLLTGYGELLATSKTVSNFCNRLISDVADAKKEPDSTLLKLTLLNACMAVYDIGKLPTATNRLVFAVKRILSWFDSGNDDEDGNKEKEASLDVRLAAESCKALQRLLPCIKDIYGSHWETSIRLCIRLWTRAAHDNAEVRLPYMHSSLKLILALKAMEEPNDDLEDALQLFSKAIWQGLLGLLELTRPAGLQAQEIMDGLLCRMTKDIPLQHVDNVGGLYGLLASDSREIQTAGFNILHRAIPAAQAELSLNAILEKKEAQLPEELLSLLQDAPSLEAYPDDVLSQFPSAVRSYLLSWHLVFDAFSKASAKVRNDYAGHLGKSDHTTAFLDFVFDVLGHSAARPLSLEKARLDAAHITGFDLAVADAEAEEYSMDWLMVHLYYLCLKYVPGLFRAWYANCRSKQTKVAVEAWTAKYFSAILTNEVLDEVAEWSEAQEEPEDDEKELLVKVSKSSKEVVAGYEVDELEASISIRLPSNYPIDGVTVTGNNRVAVDEKKWQSWLMITQGVITFSNGSVIDGLATFRRNVVGALKGQSECAICYSIISSDKKMPDKRCGTCKNLFHKTCLYKWFQTSNQNTCPLCRNPISFLGADSRVRRGGRGYDD